MYVADFKKHTIWAYRLDGSKLLDPRLVRGFADFEVDGLRTDVDGRIYLARLSAGKIAIIAANGSLEREVPVSGKQPTNLSFGGPDGRTVFVPSHCANRLSFNWIRTGISRVVWGSI
jgi:sugar lactone lactonase YvrE